MAATPSSQPGLKEHPCCLSTDVSALLYPVLHYPVLLYPVVLSPTYLLNYMHVCAFSQKKVPGSWHSFCSWYSQISKGETGRLQTSEDGVIAWSTILIQSGATPV